MSFLFLILGSLSTVIASVIVLTEPIDQTKSMFFVLGSFVLTIGSIVISRLNRIEKRLE
jgi:uncharacterized membrane protein HdeD (DUF308 family)